MLAGLLLMCNAAYNISLKDGMYRTILICIIILILLCASYKVITKCDGSNDITMRTLTACSSSSG